MLIILLSLLLNASPAQAQKSGAGGNGISIIVDIPHIYSLNYDVLNRSSGLTYGVGLGVIPSLTFSQASVNAMNADAHVRWHPFSGAFFLGLAAGFKKYTGTGKQTVTVLAQNVPLTLDSTYSGVFVNPHLGWIWFFGNLLVGFEAGMPVGGSNAVTVTADDPNQSVLVAVAQTTSSYQSFEADLNKTVDNIVKLPYVAFRLGWKF